MSPAVIIARCRTGCGAIRFAAMDTLEDLQENARHVKRLTRTGYVVERVTTEEAKRGPWECKCERL